MYISKNAIKKKYKKYKNKYIKLKKIKGGNDIYFFVQTSIGGKHNIICTKNGDVYGFGNDEYDQLELGHEANTPTLLMKDTSIQ